MVSLRKPRPLNRKVDHLRDTKLIIIATEGEKTENQYFTIFRDTRVQVIVLPAINGKSSPKHVIERLNQFKKDFELDEDDQLWLMFDRDRWPIKNLRQIARDAIKKNYFLAISNPCFEV